MLYRISETNAQVSSKSFDLNGITLLVGRPDVTASNINIDNLSFYGINAVEQVRQYGTKIIPYGEYGNCFAGKGWSNAYNSEYKDNLVYSAFYVDETQLSILNENNLGYTEVNRISGKYTVIDFETTVRFNQQVSYYYVNTGDFVACIAYLDNVEIDGIKYDYIVARKSAYWGYYYDSNFYADFAWKSFNKGYINGVEYSISWDLGTKVTFYNSILDDRLSPLIEKLDEIPPYSITIKSADDDILAYRNEIPTIVNANCIVVGNERFLNVVGSNEIAYSLSWQNETPEGKIFLGLSTKKDSTKAEIPADSNTNVSWNYDVILYEVYGVYHPPSTTFDIQLYKNSADTDRLDKTNYLTSVGTLSGALRAQTSITNMSIVIEYNSFPTFNYVYIPIFNRYYFVTDIVSVAKNLWEISLSIDVLMTYKSGVLELSAFVERNENLFNEELIDNKRVIAQGYDVETAVVTNDVFNGQSSYILTAFGCKLIGEVNNE